MNEWCTKNCTEVHKSQNKPILLFLENFSETYKMKKKAIKLQLLFEFWKRGWDTWSWNTFQHPPKSASSVCSTAGSFLSTSYVQLHATARCAFKLILIAVGTSFEQHSSPWDNTLSLLPLHQTTKRMTAIRRQDLCHSSVSTSKKMGYSLNAMLHFSSKFQLSIFRTLDFKWSNIPTINWPLRKKTKQPLRKHNIRI